MHRDLAPSENPRNCAISFCLLLGLCLEIQILFCHQIKKKRRNLFPQNWHCLKWFVQAVSKGKMRHDSPSAWHGRFSAEPLNPEHHEPLALPFHWDKFTQNLVPAQVPLLQSKLSSVLLSDSQTALSWLKQQSDHILPETNKLGTSAPITGRLRSAASEKPLSHCCLLAGGKNN